MMQCRFGIGVAVTLAVAVLPVIVMAQTDDRAQYARIAVLHPRDGHTIDFEAGYIRHLAFHEQAKDSWVWYGWNIWAGERQRWFVYATFGHSADSLNNPVAPADDERDNILNVAPHVDYWGNAIYEYLPALSRGTGVPTATARLELTTVDLKSGTASVFEAALSSLQTALKAETLWYRMVAGGAAPRYVRMRPRPNLSAILETSREQELPATVHDFVARTTIEILTLRPTMSYGLSPARH